MLEEKGFGIDEEQPAAVQLNIASRVKDITTGETQMDEKRACDCFRAARSYVSKNCAEELEWVRGISIETLKAMTCAEFLEDYCWVVYASGFRVSVLTSKFDQLKAAFYDFDIDQICQMHSLESALTIINNHRKAEGFVEGCRLIRREGYDNFKSRSIHEGVEALRSLPFIGPITVKHLDGNIGLNDVSKDDVWLVRLAKEYAASSVEELTAFLSQKFNEKQGTVDSVLWRFCADGAWEQWRSKPPSALDGSLNDDGSPG